MRKLRAAFLRVLGLFYKGQRERDLTAEVESHLELHIKDNLRAGMSYEEARRTALLKLGGVELLKENYRDRRSLPTFERLFSDFRLTMRGLRRSPWSALLAIAIFTLSIGASTALFSVIDALLLRSLPFPDPQRLVIRPIPTSLCFSGAPWTACNLCRAQSPLPWWRIYPWRAGRRDLFLYRRPV